MMDGALVSRTACGLVAWEFVFVYEVANLIETGVRYCAACCCVIFGSVQYVLVVIYQAVACLCIVAEYAEFVGEKEIYDCCDCCCCSDADAETSCGACWIWIFVYVVVRG